MPRDINRLEVQALQTQGAAIVEILPSEEFDNEHLPGAISLPLGEIASAEQRLGQNKQRPIVVYCQGVD